MGALELTQDITSDYEQILLFQGVVVVTCLLSSVIMFALLLMLIQRAERVLADRMAKNRQLENELHSNEKLVSMGRVIASIAHEIRNPLRGAAATPYGQGRCRDLAHPAGHL